MALKTVSQLKDSVSGLLSGINLSNVDNLNGSLERAARTLIQKADIPEASGTQNIVLYEGVIDYPIDPRIFGTAINDIRPQGISRNVNDFVYKQFGEQFDRTKGYVANGTRATFEYVNGVPIIRIVSVLPQQQIILDTMSSTDDWVAAGSASGLTEDTTVFYHSPASLRFTLTGSSSGTLTKTLPNALSMSAYQGVGVAFMAIQIPTGATATNLTSLSLKVGSSSGDYNSVSDTEGFLGAWVSGEWLLVAFDFAGAATTGTPDWSAIDYVQLTLNHTATITNFRVGALWMALPTPVQILYQSAAIFLPTATTTTLTTITANTDSIILNDPAYTLYEFESAISILQQTGATEANPMMQTFHTALHGDGTPQNIGLYAHYRGDNPSQELRTVGNYYDDSSSGYRAY